MKFTYEIKGILKELEFDAAIRETHVSGMDVTDHAVEKGSNISDHARLRPRRLTVDAAVSNTPLEVPNTNMRGVTGTVQGVNFNATVKRPTETTGASGGEAGDGKLADQSMTFGANVLQFSDVFDRVRDVYEEMIKFQTQAILLDVETTYRGGLVDYTDMILENLTAPREAKDGTAITFTFDLRKITIVETQQVNTPAPKQALKNKGKQGKTEIDKEKEPEKASVAEAIKDAIVAALKK